MKKYIIPLISIVIIALCLAVFLLHGTLSGSKAGVVSSAKSALVSSADPVIYTAHRGFSGVAPENTIPAVSAAGKAGYANCEFDIRTTKDGVWVVMHDETLEKMCGDTSKKKISDYTYGELMEFDITGGNNIEDYPGTKIPTLEEVLDECKKYSMRPMIEIKSGSAQDVEKLFEILQIRGEVESAIIIAFDFAYLEQLRGISENIELLFLISSIKDDTVAKCKALNLGVAFDGRIKENHKRIQSILDAKLTAAAWTIDTIKLHDTLYEHGVRYITTNYITP